MKYDRYAPDLDHLLLGSLYAQGIKIDPEVKAAVHNNKSSVYYSVEPSGCASGLVEIGQVGHGSGRTIVDGIFEPPEALLEDPAAAALSRALVESASGKNHIDAVYTAPDSARQLFTATCSEAEQRFGQVIASSLIDNGGRRVDYGCRVIVDESDTPILLQKILGEPSALSLAPIRAGSITYPAGYLMAVKLIDDDIDEETSIPEPVDFPHHDVEVVGSGDIELLSPLRLSSFGYQPATRQNVFRKIFDNQYALSEPRATPVSSGVIANMTLGEISGLARYAVSDMLPPPTPGQLF